MKSLLHVFLAAAGLTLALAGAAQSDSSAAGAALPNDDTTIVHVLNRIGFGPRPGDVERVRAIGLQTYIDQQLHPERMADEPVAGRLAAFTTLDMSTRQIVEEFERPALEMRRRRQQEQQQGASQPEPGPLQMPNPAPQQASRVLAELGAQKMLRAVYSERQLQEVLTDFWFNHFNVDARKGRARFLLTEYERDAIRPHVLGRFRDLLEATAKSPAMLFYLDNWMSADPNGPHRDAGSLIGGRGARRRAGPGGFGRGGVTGLPAPRPNAPQNMRRGLNENYARELMELHTLGVDGGYTQKDVTEVARAFTGWTIEDPRTGGGFRFEGRIHDPGEKVVLGHGIKAGGGQRDGEQVLDILATHPSTARFIAASLARRFVSDAPPAALVDRAAARFRETDGDLREVTRTLLLSPEFLSTGAHRAKVKTPLEFVASAVRATGADVADAAPLVRVMQQLGMPLYMCQPPTGYKDTADAWVNTGALVGRMNVAVALAGGRLPGISLDPAALLDEPRPSNDTAGARGATVPDRRLKVSKADRLVATLLGNDASETTRTTIARAATIEQMAALTLGSPEFQRR